MSSLHCGHYSNKSWRLLATTTIISTCFIIMSLLQTVCTDGDHDNLHPGHSLSTPALAAEADPLHPGHSLPVPAPALAAEADPLHPGHSLPVPALASGASPLSALLGNLPISQSAPPLSQLPELATFCDPPVLPSLPVLSNSYQIPCLPNLLPNLASGSDYYYNSLPNLPDGPFLPSYRIPDTSLFNPIPWQF